MEYLPHQGGDDLPTPEAREALRIKSIVIPADDAQPLRQHELAVTDLDAYQELVGGNIEAIGLDDPAASMYFHGDGKHLDLPVNGRATLLLWAHVSELRFRDYIVGDAFLTGPLDRDGNDTDVSDEFTKLFFETSDLRIAVRTYGDSKWYTNDLSFDEWSSAYAYALDLGHRWTQVEDIRVVTEQPLRPPQSEERS